MAVTIKDVARNCGMSISTVSKVFNGYPDISGETRDVVMKVARQMGYQPNALARALKQPVCVRLSGYDVQTLARCRDYADVKIGQPALFRIINPAPLRQAARELGLPEDTLYAPYLT